MGEQTMRLLKGVRKPRRIAGAIKQKIGFDGANPTELEIGYNPTVITV